MLEEILSGKVVVISGGTKGLGRGVAIEAARRGAKVVIGGRSQLDGSEVVRFVNEHKGDAFFVSGDFRKVEDCERLVGEAEGRYGRIDGLVNYTGILPVGSLTETTEELFDNIFDTNVKAAFFITKFAMERMIKGGGGSIVNIGSLHGYGGDIDRAAYACSKGALLTLTKHIAKNYSKDRIRANWVTMGWVATPGELELRGQQGHGIEWLEQQARELMPMRRLQTVEDNVPAILFLLSDYAGQVSGTELHITGGWFF
jgi:NAD(P)-dependent dehydrogenase (short-subunit alcohol dehydrogenase family)